VGVKKKLTKFRDSMQKRRHKGPRREATCGGEWPPLFSSPIDVFLEFTFESLAFPVNPVTADQSVFEATAQFEWLGPY